MKIDRLIGILSILLQQEKVTAPYLAMKFEVSRRTINRDIENLCKAGISVVTEQGTNGGISIMDGYRMDIMIDLASWYRSALAPKIEWIQSAIGGRKKIEFTYYSPNGESHRKIEPYLLVFQWSSWYIWGYCCEKHDFRLFKLNRMQDEVATGEVYEPRSVAPLQTAGEQICPVKIQAKALFSAEMKWRLIEEFGMDSFSEQRDGKLLFEFGFADKENLFGWLLSFGNCGELLEPKHLRKEFGKILKEVANKYE